MNTPITVYQSDYANLNEDKVLEPFKQKENFILYMQELRKLFQARSKSLKNTIHVLKQSFEEDNFISLIKDDKQCQDYLLKRIDEICISQYDKERELYIQKLIQKISSYQTDKIKLQEDLVLLNLELNQGRQKQKRQHSREKSQNSRTQALKDFNAILKENTLNNIEEQNKQSSRRCMDKKVNDLYEELKFLQNKNDALIMNLHEKDEKFKVKEKKLQELELELQKYSQISKDLVKEKQKIQDHYMQQILVNIEEIKLQYLGFEEPYYRIRQQATQRKREERKAEGGAKRYEQSLHEDNKTFEQKLQEKIVEIEKGCGKTSNRSISQKYNSRNEFSSHSRNKTMTNVKSINNGQDDFMSTIQMGLTDQFASFESASRNGTTQRKKKCLNKSNSVSSNGGTNSVNLGSTIKSSGSFINTKDSRTYQNERNSQNMALHSQTQSFSYVMEDIQASSINNEENKQLGQNQNALPISSQQNPQDPFDRQRRIQNWNQTKVEEQVCLLLGSGGLGCSVAMGLARLGVAKLIMIDKDVVDVSNLNRQILFDHEDVGKAKVFVARDKLLKNHLINKNMVIEAYNFCALKEWQKIVELSKQSTVVFNMIDVGDYFDAAVQALCMKRNLPLILGGTFSQQITVDIFMPKESCLSCSADSYSPEMLQKIVPSLIEDLPDLEFIPRNNNPIGQSNCYLCVICAQMMVARFSTLLINDPEIVIQSRLIMTVNSAEAFQYPIARDDKCLLCDDYEKLTDPEGYVLRKNQKLQEQLEKKELEQQNLASEVKSEEQEQIKSEEQELKENNQEQSNE
ncbi:family protein [Stylonychia lemnae]|uniref:Family protein n=1 Tax=Stylonychia lemnae TaxID=5949 RepID=A0A078BAH3_STYLE|nr:family protein [Stylonychia lemnae]|eukprot:CDW91226.1 family protein [Stylonychia lemnae]